MARFRIWFCATALAAAPLAAAAELPAAYKDAVAAKDFPRLLQLMNEQFDLPPYALTPPPAVYPDIAGQAGAQGVVKLAVFIDEAGDVKDAVVVDSPGWLALEEAARRAVSEMKYRPAELDDGAVAVWYIVDLIFYIPSDER